MLLDIFSSLDFQFRKFIIIRYSVWLIGVIWLWIILFNFYLYKNSLNFIFIILRQIFYTNINRPKNPIFQHVFVLVYRFSFLIIFINFWSLIPYVYGMTTSLIVGFTFGFRYWLMLQFRSIRYSLNHYARHYVFFGTPLALAIPLSFADLVNAIVRPFTLTLRLVINMSIGHVIFSLLGLVGSKMLFKNFWLGIVILGILFCFFAIELCVGVIQSVVFGLLNINYLGDHS